MQPANRKQVTQVTQSPPITIYNQQIEDFKQQIDIVLSKQANQKYPSIIVGDINIDLTK